jgi:hypothetical protein
MPPAVALLNYISCGILWRIFCQTGIFRGVFSIYCIIIKVIYSYDVMSCSKLSLILELLYIPRHEVPPLPGIGAGRILDLDTPIR